MNCRIAKLLALAGDWLRAALKQASASSLAMRDFMDVLVQKGG